MCECFLCSIRTYDSRSYVKISVCMMYMYVGVKRIRICVDWILYICVRLD